MSLACSIGPEANMLEPTAEQCHRLILPHPILSLADLEVLKATRHRGWRVSYLYCFPIYTPFLSLIKLRGFLHKHNLDAVYPVDEGNRYNIRQERGSDWVIEWAE